MTLKQKRARFLELEEKAKREREKRFSSPYALTPFLNKKDRQEFRKLYDEVVETDTIQKDFQKLSKFGRLFGAGGENKT